MYQVRQIVAVVWRTMGAVLVFEWADFDPSYAWVIMLTVTPSQQSEYCAAYITSSC